MLGIQWKIWEQKKGCRDCNCFPHSLPFFFFSLKADPYIVVRDHVPRLTKIKPYPAQTPLY